MRKFEISYGLNVYWGEYYIEQNNIVIDNVFTQNDEEQEIELDSINDKEIYQRVSELAIKSKESELLDDEEYENELKYAIAEERADEKRKYGTK